MGRLVLSYLREYLFPSGCGGCGEVLRNREEAYRGLCAACADFLAAALEGESRCETCGRPLVSERDTCLSCRERESSGAPFRFLKRRSIFPYTGKYRTILRRYKFEKSRAIAHCFIEYLESALDDFDPASLRGAEWVPVPPRPGKIKTSGWDQVEYLAKLLERKYRRGIAANAPPIRAPLLPVRRCLTRLPSRSQKELNREDRSTNLAGHILCAKPPPRTAIVLDDVVTTGATLDACARALLEGGADKVYGVCLFYD